MFDILSKKRQLNVATIRQINTQNILKIQTASFLDEQFSVL